MGGSQDNTHIATMRLSLGKLNTIMTRQPDGIMIVHSKPEVAGIFATRYARCSTKQFSAI